MPYVIPKLLFEKIILKQAFNSQKQVHLKKTSAEGGQHEEMKLMMLKLENDIEKMRKKMEKMDKEIGKMKRRSKHSKRLLSHLVMCCGHQQHPD